MTELDGYYFAPNAAYATPARATVVPKRILQVEDEHGDILAQALGRQVSVSARLVSLPRSFELPDGGRFETADNGLADSLIWDLRKRRRGRFTSMLERVWPAALLALLIALFAGYSVFVQVLPVAAEWLAMKTLPQMSHTMSEQTLSILDRYAVTRSYLKPEEKARAAAVFARVAAHAPGGAGAYRLVFRGGGKMGPNAFALPDGTIVMTDPLLALIQDDAELEGVFAHEMSHVDHAHGLQRVYAAALLPAALAIFTGDLSQVSRMAAILPGMISDGTYPRAFERQADDDAAATLRAAGAKPSHTANLMLRLDHALCGGAACRASWVADHPETAARAARLRLEDFGPVTASVDCARPWRTGLSLRCLGLAAR